MWGDVRQIVRCFVTPADLRRLADKLDATWAERHTNGDLTGGLLFVNAECQVELVVDQERMEAQHGRED